MPQEQICAHPFLPSPIGLSAHPDSLLCSFDGVDVANDGTVPFRRGERIAFSYLVSQMYTGETARLQILRGAQQHNVEVKLGGHNRLVPVHTSGKPPSYYIVAGELHCTQLVRRTKGQTWVSRALDSSARALTVLTSLFGNQPTFLGTGNRRTPSIGAIGIGSSVFGKLWDIPTLSSVLISLVQCFFGEPLFPSLFLAFVYMDAELPRRFAGLVFTPVSVPYLASEYGKNFEFDAPVKLLDKMMHVMAEAADQQVVVVSQVSLPWETWPLSGPRRLHTGDVKGGLVPAQPTRLVEQAYGWPSSTFGAVLSGNQCARRSWTGVEM